MSREKTGKTLACEECTKDIYVPGWKLEKSQNYFCSTDCHNEFQTEDIVKECKNCGNTFTTKKYDENDYCSKSCYGKSKVSKESVACTVCGEDILLHKYRVEKQDRFYCSDECRSVYLSEQWTGQSNPQYKDGKYRDFGNNWMDVKKKVREMSNGVCEDCGKSEDDNGRKLDIHHVIPRSYFIDFDERTVEESNCIDNLIVLCQSCHSKHERFTDVIIKHE